MAAVVAAGLAGACNRGDSGGSEPTVALVLKTLNNPFFIEMAQGAQEAADSLGVELLVQAPEREIDVEKQMQIVENLLQTEIDVLRWFQRSREIVPAIEQANKAGVPVVSWTREWTRALAEPASSIRRIAPTTWTVGGSRAVRAQALAVRAGWRGRSFPARDRRLQVRVPGSDRSIPVGISCRSQDGNGARQA